MAKRTWEEVKDAETGEAVRWNMLIDDALFEEAYIELVEKGTYALHFPRLVETTVPSLPVAMATLENAPLTKRRGIAIGHETKSDIREDFMGIDEVVTALGVSRSRVTAMIANGVLSAKRFDGEVVVSSASVEAYGAQDGKPQARGRFANKFIQYFPDREKNEFYLAEVDVSDSDQVIEAQAFVDSVRDTEKHPGGARLVGYRSAMKLKSSSHRIDATNGAAFMGLEEFLSASFSDAATLSV